MPVTYALDDARRIVNSRAWGSVSESDLLGHVASMRELFANGTLDASWSQIAEFGADTSLAELSTDSIRRLAQANPWPLEARRVFIAPTGETYGLTRMYQMLSSVDVEQFSVVATKAEALELLMESRGRDGEVRS